MNRTQVAMLALLGLLAVVIAVLALRNPQAPRLPSDADHATFVNAAGCLDCHGPESTLPRSKNHPLGDDCVRCHGRR